MFYNKYENNLSRDTFCSAKCTSPSLMLAIANPQKLILRIWEPLTQTTAQEEGFATQGCPVVVSQSPFPRKHRSCSWTTATPYCSLHPSPKALATVPPEATPREFPLFPSHNKRKNTNRVVFFFYGAGRGIRTPVAFGLTVFKTASL